MKLQVQWPGIIVRFVLCCGVEPRFDLPKQEGKKRGREIEEEELDMVPYHTL